MRHLIPLLFTLVLSTSGFAAEEQFADEDLPIEDAQTMTANLDSSAPKKYSLGLGSGVLAPTGNLGKLYSNSASINLRGEYNILNRLAGRFGIQRAGFDFNAQPNGAVDVQLTSFSLDGVFYPIGEGNEKLDLYVFAGISHNRRSQNFQSMGLTERDNSFGYQGGVGLSYSVAEKASLYAEMSLQQMAFKDRFQETYASSGISDTTGAIFSSGAGLQYYF